MENEKQLDNKKKATMLIIGLVVVLAAVVAIVLAMPKGEKKPVVNTNTPDGSQVETPDGNVPGGEGETPGSVDFEEPVNPVLEGAVVNAPGANLITKEGKVVNEEGKAVRSDVAYNSPEAPRQTQAIENEDDIKDAVKLTLGDDGFSPKEFSVKPGAAVTIALTGTNESSHVLAFEDKKLGAVYINIRPGETRAVTFNAPDDAGDYTFFCDFPGHKNRGEVGVMKVQ